MLHLIVDFLLANILQHSLKKDLEFLLRSIIKSIMLNCKDYKDIYLRPEFRTGATIVNKVKLPGPTIMSLVTGQIYGYLPIVVPFFWKENTVSNTNSFLLYTSPSQRD